uniref:Potassium channel domain-containing protein n=1 Tax=Acrobeloides nanus TaxID=290746 RepID=A0A914CN83_9BILA
MVYFIGLSTIGLGDVIVKRRDLMVLCFFFVITGLSLVSMCINVVQQAIEEWYKELLMQLLKDYQANLAKGDHKGASIGMMKMWGSNKMAKYIMPMMSADTKRHVMEQIQEEAKEAGIELPPIFEDLDAKTGMPKILALADEKDEDKKSAHAAMIEEIVRQSDPTRLSIPSRGPLPTVVYYEADTQTDILLIDEKAQQTIDVESLDSGIQTDSTEPDLSDEILQTDEIETLVEETQTNAPDIQDSQTMTHIATLIDTEIQTIIEFHDSVMQTEPPEVSVVETQYEAEPTISEETQTPILEFVNSQTMTNSVMLDNKDIQTVDVESIDSGMQTDTREASLCETQSQTEAIAVKLQETQTPIIEMKDLQTMTHIINLQNSEIQTEKVQMREQQLQTHIVDYLEMETQTEKVECKNIRIQTPMPEIVDTEMQTDPIGRVVPSRVTEAKRRIQRALRSRSRQGRDKRRMSVADPSMSNWRDVSSSQDEEEKIEEAEGEVYFILINYPNIPLFPEA